MKNSSSLPKVNAWPFSYRPDIPRKGERTMAQCNLSGSCVFFNNGLSEMPCTTECLKEKYCWGDYTECALFIVANTYGRDKRSRFLSPNDLLESIKVN